MSDFSKDWQLFSSGQTGAKGSQISTPSFNIHKSYQIDIPATVMAALVRKDVYKNVFYSDNLKNIPKEPFHVPWWYRKVFQINDLSGSFYELIFEGLNYKANIWLNGVQIATSDDVEGCFRIFKYDVSRQLIEGENVLAVEVIPPKKGDLTIGFVDWNPWPPDNNMGLWRPVKLKKSGSIALNNVFVRPDLNVENLKEAKLQITADVVNHTDNPVNGTLEIAFDNSIIEKDIQLGPNESRKIELTTSEFESLNIVDPKLWWPHHLGEPYLYNLNAKAIIGEEISDSTQLQFGIRDIQDYFNENGHRGYKINGREVLIKGAGWVDDIFLDDSNEKVMDQLRYVKHMNLNTIRLEGFWGKNKTIYEMADRLGILIMIGWSCQWEWEAYCGRPESEYLAIRGKKEISEHAQAYQDQVEWLRNHPSVFLWVYGSDKLLVPELEQRLNKMIAAEDGTRPILNSCGSAVSEVTGKSGVKMNGPYAYVTPNYWYVDDKKGGAFGFNTETGPGVQPSPLSSVKRMIPEEQLWPVDSIWEFHLGRREFTTFEHWMKPFNERYGGADNVEDFTFMAQMANYEAMRPMFEAFHVNRPNSTGVIQWMLNSAFPNMLWQLYDWYLMPNGAFYAARNANRPLNIVYNYKDNGIYLTSDYFDPIEDLTAEIRIFNNKGVEVFTKSIDAIAKANGSVKIYNLPELDEMSATYFLDLRINDSHGENRAINFYWLSTREDILDYDNSSWFVTGNSEYADLSGIRGLDSIKIDVSREITVRGDTVFLNLDVTNPTDRLAFFIEMEVVDSSTGQPLLPVFWEDNYVSLLPGEQRLISGYLLTKDVVDKDRLNINLKGWNLK